MHLIDYIWLFLSGLGGGILAGILGIGGGIIYVLIFSFYLPLLAKSEISGYDMVKLTISNSLFSLIFVGAAGSYKQYKKSNFYIKPVLITGMAGIAGSILTTAIISVYDIYSKSDFTIIFIACMIPIIIKMMMKPKKVPSEELSYNPIKLLFLGLFAGIGMALSGLGGGFLIIPVLNGLFNISMKRTISISLGVISIMALGASIFNLIAWDYSALELPMTIGSVSLPMVIPVIIGVLFGAPFGVIVSHKLPDRILKIFFLIFTFLVVIKFITEIWPGS